jgi:hypothetical protein
MTVTSYGDLDADARRDTDQSYQPSADEQLEDFFAEFFAHSLAVQEWVYGELSPYLQDAINAERAIRERLFVAAVREQTDDWHAAQAGKVA